MSHDPNSRFTIQVGSYIFLAQNYIKLEPIKFKTLYHPQQQQAVIGWWCCYSTVDMDDVIVEAGEGRILERFPCQPPDYIQVAYVHIHTACILEDVMVRLLRKLPAPIQHASHRTAALLKTKAVASFLLACLVHCLWVRLRFVAIIGSGQAVNNGREERGWFGNNGRRSLGGGYWP